jgi:hypothetical protein
MVEHVCTTSYAGYLGCGPRLPKGKCIRFYLKSYLDHKGERGVAQLVEHLTNKCEVLNSNSTKAKERKREREREKKKRRRRSRGRRRKRRRKREREKERERERVGGRERRDGSGGYIYRERKPSHELGVIQ